MEISNVKVFKINGSSKVKANGECVLGGCVKVRFTVIEGQNGPFVGLPGEYYTDKEGNKKWSSKVEVVNKDFAKQLEDKVLEVYRNPPTKSNSSSSSKSSKSDLPSDL